MVLAKLQEGGIFEFFISTDQLDFEDQNQKKTVIYFSKEYEMKVD